MYPSLSAIKDENEKEGGTWVATRLGSVMEEIWHNARGEISESQWEWLPVGALLQATTEKCFRKASDKESNRWEFGEGNSLDDQVHCTGWLHKTCAYIITYIYIRCGQTQYRIFARWVSKVTPFCKWESRHTLYHNETCLENVCSDAYIGSYKGSETHKREIM